MRDIEIAGDEVADAPIDLLPKIEVMRIERVVEIEHPGLDVGEATLGQGAGRGGMRHSNRLDIAILGREEGFIRAESVKAIPRARATVCDER